MWHGNRLSVWTRWSGWFVGWLVGLFVGWLGGLIYGKRQIDKGSITRAAGPLLYIAQNWLPSTLYCRYRPEEKKLYQLLELTTTAGVRELLYSLFSWITNTIILIRELAMCHIVIDTTNVTYHIVCHTTNVTYRIVCHIEAVISLLFH